MMRGPHMGPAQAIEHLARFQYRNIAALERGF